MTQALHHHYRPAHVLELRASTTALLQWNAHGQLTLSAPGQEPIAITPVAAFALSAPRECISLVDLHGKERAYIPLLDALPAEMQQCLEAALAQREFIPVITAIHSVSSFSTPTVWRIQTDRGATELHLQSEDDIRKLDAEGRSLRITSKNSLQYAVADINALPKASRKLLARFI